MRPDDPHAHLSAWVPGVARAAMFVSWGVATAAAIFMTATYQLGKWVASRDDWGTLISLLGVGVACDVWVTTAPILLPRALPRRPVVFVLALVCFVLALQITGGNKLGFWAMRSDARRAEAAAELAAAQARAPSEAEQLRAAADRALVDRGPPARTALEAQAEVQGLEAELARMEREPERWRTRIYETGQRLTAAREAFAQATAYDAALARLAALGRVDITYAAAPPEVEFDPRDRVIAETLQVWGEAIGKDRPRDRFGAWLRTATPHGVELWMHGLTAAFHELLCGLGLIFAGLVEARARRWPNAPAELGAVAEAPAMAESAEARALRAARQRGDSERGHFWGRLFGAAGDGWRAFARDVVWDSNLRPRPQARPVQKGLRLPGPAALPAPEARTRPISALDQARRSQRPRPNAAEVIAPAPAAELTAELWLSEDAPLVLALEEAAAGSPTEYFAAHVAAVREEIAEDRQTAAALREAGRLEEAQEIEARANAEEAELEQIIVRRALPGRDG